MGYEQFFYNIHDDLALIEEMMDVFTEDALSMIGRLLQRNVTTLMIADDIAYKGGLFIDPGLFRRLWLPRMRRLVAPIHAAGVPVFFHSDGQAGQFIEMLIELGIMGVNPLETQCNDIVAMKHRYGKDIVLMGNMDMGGVLAFGTPDDVRREMTRLLLAMMPGGGYVAMSSNSIADSVVPENYQTMIETVLEKGVFR